MNIVELNTAEIAFVSGGKKRKPSKNNQFAYKDIIQAGAAATVLLVMLTPAVISGCKYLTGGTVFEDINGLLGKIKNAGITGAGLYLVSSVLGVVGYICWNALEFRLVGYLLS